MVCKYWSCGEIRSIAADRNNCLMVISQSSIRLELLKDFLSKMTTEHISPNVHLSLVQQTRSLDLIVVKLGKEQNFYASIETWMSP